MLDAIGALGNIIKCPGNQHLSRLAYIQPARMLAALKEKIKYDHGRGLILGKRSQRDATVAINLYLSAAGRASKEEIYKLTRPGKRWAAFTGRYPLLLITFTDEAGRWASREPSRGHAGRGA